ncbi:MAG TPA: hypothetical protein VGB98_08550 [Pyrinomonadaceae bacterium]
MGLNVALHRTCVSVLMRCAEFKDRRDLEVLFGIEPLPKYAGALPLEARSQMHLAELVLHNLVNYPAEKGSPLLDLLSVLRDKRDEEEKERDEIERLLKQVSFYLSSVAAETGAGESVAGRKEAEAKEFRAAIQNYQLADGELGDAPDTDAASWIAQVHDEPGPWAFRVALVVFNGAPWDTCMEAALDLATRLTTPAPAATGDDAQAATPPPATTPPVTTLPSPLKLLVEAGGELTSAGTFRVVKLKDPQLARGVLDYVWDEYTRRGVLTEWLTGLSVNRNFVKRLRASVAAGLLALTNFDSIRRGMLYDWARTGEERALHRQAVGRALGVAAEGGRSEDVRDLLKLWAGSPDYALRWAAARAYIFVCARCPVEEVLTQWRAIADAEDFSALTVGDGNFYVQLVNGLLVSLLDAMERFFLIAAETPEVRKSAFTDGLVGFRAWADDKGDEPGDGDESGPTIVGHFGLLMFIKLARILLPGEGEESAWPPVLLTLIEPREESAPYRRCLADMFERMLRDPAAQPTALDLLRNWQERVERDPVYEPRMRALLSDLLARGGGSENIRRPLARQLGLWSPSSRFALREPRPELGHLRRTVIVADGSQSALPFRDEIKGVALEIGAALPDDPPPEVYLLNSGRARTLASLADADQPTAGCSLLAPVMRALRSREERVDALILVGNGEVFDLADWLADPLVERWVLVRAGPDALACGAAVGVEELSGDSLPAVYERLCAPPAARAPRPPRPPAPSAAGESGWRLDRSGYPMIYVEPLERHVHLFPVSKPQFERFLADDGRSGLGDEDYAEMLKQNPRASFRAADGANPLGFFLTGVKPVEAEAFGGWLGEGYGLPGEKQWKTCYDWLGSRPVTGPPHGLAEDALAIWLAVDARRSPRTLLELSLMTEGVREWVTAGPDKYGGLGRPARRFSTLSRDPLQMVTVTDPAERQQAYGFRLLAR